MTLLQSTIRGGLWQATLETQVRNDDMMVKIKKYMLMGFVCTVCFMVPYIIGNIVGNDGGAGLLFMFWGGIAWTIAYDLVWGGHE